MTYQKYLAELGNQDARLQQSQSWISDYVNSNINLDERKSQILEAKDLLFGEKAKDALAGIEGVSGSVGTVLEAVHGFRENSLIKTISDKLSGKSEEPPASEEPGTELPASEEPAAEVPAEATAAEAELPAATTAEDMAANLPAGAGGYVDLSANQGYSLASNEAVRVEANPASTSADAQQELNMANNYEQPEEDAMVDLAPGSSTELQNMASLGIDSQVESEASQAIQDTSGALEGVNAGFDVATGLSVAGGIFGALGGVAGLGLTIFDGIEQAKQLADQLKQEHMVNTDENIISAFSKPVIGFGNISANAFDTSDTQGLSGAFSHF